MIRDIDSVSVFFSLMMCVVIRIRRFQELKIRISDSIFIFLCVGFGLLIRLLDLKNI